MRPATRAAPVHGRPGMHAGLVGVVLLFAFGGAFAAPKTDVVVLKNGDRITGEIKGLERGILSLSTDAAGTISIEWPEVARIETKQYLEVEQLDGDRSYGHASRPAETGSVVLGTDDDPDATAQAPLALDDIVRITPISEGRWIDHINGHASIGLSAASANDNRQVTLSGDMTYRAPERSWTVTYEGARTESTNNPVSDRQDVDGTYRWLRPERWFWAATGGFASNDELDLKLRSLVGAGRGRYWVQDANRAFGTVGGLVFSREHYEGQDRQESFEALLQFQFEYFRFQDPEVDLSFDLSIFPSLTVSGRLRSEVSAKARYELVKDLYWELSYIRSQDNKPVSDEASKNDWSLNSSLGYKF